MLYFRCCGLISVPFFKTITHLPPYLGMLLALGIIWIVSELMNPHLSEAEKKPYTAAGALARIDVASVLFFLGILAGGCCAAVHGTSSPLCSIPCRNYRR